jgi:hypothetical protein
MVVGNILHAVRVAHMFFWLLFGQEIALFGVVCRSSLH